MAQTKLRAEQLPTIRDTLSANRTYYVRTDGSDSNDGLTDSSGGAFLTADKANTVVATLDKNGYNVTVQFGAGTWNETVVLAEGAGDGIVRWQGAFTSLESVTSATVAAGSGATHGTVTKTSQFTGDDYSGKLVYFSTDDTYRVIESNTNDVLTLVGTGPSSTTQDVVIYDWGTILNRVDVYTQNIELYNMRFDASGTNRSIYIEGGKVKTYFCRYDKQMSIYGGFLAEMFYSVLYNNTGADAFAFYYNSVAWVVGCLFKFEHTLAYAESFNNGSALMQGSVIDGDDGIGGKASYGIWVFANGVFVLSCPASRGNNIIKNCDVGIQAQEGGVSRGTASVSFSGNTTDKNAISASYGYID